MKKLTTSYEEDGTLWTRFDVSYITAEDYTEYFEDVLNNMYIGYGDITGEYADIEVIRNTECEPVVRVVEENGTKIVELGIKNYKSSEKAPNCVIANIVLDEEATSLTDEEGRRAIIVFFN